MDAGPRIVGIAVDLGAYEFSTALKHPADVNGDWVISAAEYNAYAAAWQTNGVWSIAPASITTDYVTRAGYIKVNGGAYHNDGSAKPTCWKIGQ